MPWASKRSVPLPKHWDKIRRRILRRDPHCQLRHPDHCTHHSTEVDHIHNSADHQDTNLRGVCRSCHHRRTLTQAQAVNPTRSAKREPEKHPGIID